MQCPQVESYLEEYNDGELDYERAAQIQLHLGACRSCAAELVRLQAEQEAYLAYERRLEFDPRLWNGVQSRLAVSNGPRWSLSAWLLAVFATPRTSIPVTVALVLLSVLVTVKFMSTPNKMTAEQAKADVKEQQQIIEPKLEEEPAVAPREAALRSEPRRTERVAVKRNQPSSPQQLVREAEMKYLAAIAILSRRVAEQEPSLGPEARLRLEETLAAIDRNIAATRQAVRKHPEDPMAVHYMLTAYARKVEVLREMTGH